MDECIQKIHFEIGFIQDGELDNAIVTNNMSEVKMTNCEAEEKTSLIIDEQQHNHIKVSKVTFSSSIFSVAPSQTLLADISWAQ